MHVWAPTAAPSASHQQHSTLSGTWLPLARVHACVGTDGSAVGKPPTAKHAKRYMDGRVPIAWVHARIHLGTAVGKPPTECYTTIVGYVLGMYQPCVSN